MAQRLKATPVSELTPIDEFAATWEVAPKTVQNWVEFVYQAFEIMLPVNGPFPDWAVQLLNIVGKHVSTKASLYFAETGEVRRLKGAEFIQKIRSLRAQGHFQEFQQFQNFQNFQTDEDEYDLENDTLAELGSITRGNDQSLSVIKQAIEQKEDEEIDDLVRFMEDSDRRKMAKLVNRLKARQLPTSNITQTINATYRRVSG